MEYFVGLDVSVKTTSICVMDATGKIIREGKAGSSPEEITSFLSQVGKSYGRVGLEAALFANGFMLVWLTLGFLSSVSKPAMPRLC